MERSVYINGRLVPESQATISIFDVGRLYGASFYESIRTFGHRLFRPEAHFDRLRRSLAYAAKPSTTCTSLWTSSSTS